MAGNDLLAAGALRAARVRGVRVPDDVAVAGFADFRFCAYVKPALTTVALPAYDIGEAAALTLIDHLEGGEPARHQQLPVELLVRRLDLIGCSCRLAQSTGI